MSPNDDEAREQQRRQERREDQRRENILFGTVTIIALIGATAALIAATKHGLPSWLFILGNIGAVLVVVPTAGLAWFAIFSRVFGWTVEKPLAKLKTVVQKDDVVSLFTIIIAPVQTLIWFASGEIIEDKRQKIAIGVVAIALSTAGGICATLAKNKRMYVFGAGSVGLSLVPTVVAASHYHRWIESFGKAGIFNQTMIIGALVASILLLVLVIISWPLVKKPKTENQDQPNASNPATAPHSPG